MEKIELEIEFFTKYTPIHYQNRSPLILLASWKSLVIIVTLFE